MLGLDTNVLVRYLVQDDLQQAAMASQYIEKASLQNEVFFLNHIVVCELIWVLDSCYKYEKKVLIDVLEKILNINEFQIEDKDVVWQALFLYQEQRVDFSDCLIAVKNLNAGCRKTLSFDKAAAKILDVELVDMS